MCLVSMLRILTMDMGRVQHMLKKSIRNQQHMPKLWLCHCLCDYKAAKHGLVDIFKAHILTTM